MRFGYPGVLSTWLAVATSEVAMLGGNDPGWCGSAKKYKRCHLESVRAEETIEGGLTLDAVAIRFGEVAGRLSDFGSAARRVPMS